MFCKAQHGHQVALTKIGGEVHYTSKPESNRFAADKVETRARETEAGKVEIVLSESTEGVKSEGLRPDLQRFEQASQNFISLNGTNLPVTPAKIRLMDRAEGVEPTGHTDRFKAGKMGLSRMEKVAVSSSK